MSLSQRLAEYVAAAFTGVWVQSHGDFGKSSRLKVGP